MKVVLDDGAFIPVRAHDTDAGLDLKCREDFVIEPHGSALIDTGVHIAFDHGTYGKIESKSGLNVRHGIVSCGGVIDEGYVGSITVKLYNLSTIPYAFRRGDKVAQLVVMPYLVPDMVEVDELEPTERGFGAFGSTGR